MTTTTKRTGASNSFTLREINAPLEMHACVLRGGDARHVAQSIHVCSVIRKFRGMYRRYVVGTPADVAVVPIVPAAAGPRDNGEVTS
jgi:hypothetical protein